LDNSTDVSAIDGHFSLQASHCNLRNQLHRYTIIALMDKQSLPHDASCLMEKAGIGKYNYKGKIPPSHFGRSNQT